MDQYKAKQDMLLMLLFMAASLILLYFIIPNYIVVTKMMEQEVFTPRTFPTLIGYGILLVSGIGFVESLLRYKSAVKAEGKQPKPKKTKEELHDTLFPYFIYALIVVFVVIYSTVGIIPASILVPPVMLWFLNCRNWKCYVAYFVFVALIYLLFTQVLLVPLK